MSEHHSPSSEADPHRLAETWVLAARLREAFDYVCGLLLCGPSPLEREADTYVVSCMVNVGELRRVKALRAALAQPPSRKAVRAND